ncbi:12704_t:CDS:1, partial [Racocetra persica]
KLVQKLVEILKPFNNATEYFSGRKYSIIASVYPLIEALKVHYAKDIDINEDNNNDIE